MGSKGWVHKGVEDFQPLQKVQYTPIENASTIKPLNQRSELNLFNLSSTPPIDD